MVKVLFEMDDKEDEIVNLVKAIHYLKDKKLAIKKIIREYGKNIRIENKNG